jgi:polar amino acid transport system permease protein
MEFTLWDILRNLLLAARWTVGLTFVAFIGGSLVGIIVLLLGISSKSWVAKSTSVYIGLIEGTPLLMQLFLVFFGLPSLGVRPEPLPVACVTLSLYGGAFLADIWEGGVRAVPSGQWEAAASLGLHRSLVLSLVILPQAFRMTSAPTVGFLVQLLKNTSLTSIIGFDEIMKTANAITNAIFAPFIVYGFVMMIFFAMCFPLTQFVRYLEKRASPAERMSRIDRRLPRSAPNRRDSSERAKNA